jgi:predicted TIM-barrel enzyme
MKITKAQLKQLIKEELGVMSEQDGDEVYLLVEPSGTYEGAGREVAVIGAFFSREEAQEALKHMREGYMYSILSVPVGLGGVNQGGHYAEPVAGDRP